MSWLWTSLALVTIFFFLQAFSWKTSTKTNKKLPPGPKGFPIFGCLHLLGQFPHRALHKLAERYGPIMHLRLGLMPTIVVSSPQAAELFLKTHDLIFASRPPLQAAKHISYEQKGLALSPYGSYWRTIRKICTLELLSSFKINSFQAMRKEELDLLIASIKEAACARCVVDLSTKVSAMSADMTCRMVFGKKYSDDEFDERGFKTVIQEGMELSAKPNLGDYIPPIAGLDLQGLTKRMKSVAKVFDGFLEKIIDEHVQSKDENRTKDFVDVMLSFEGSEETEHKIEREHIKAIILDMLSAAMDTSATAVEWALSELIKHPKVMKKLQKELEKIVGLSRMVEESDLENLEYLDMVVKETLRLHPVGPLLIPHESTEDCTVNRFHIPKKSRVIINVWAIGRDPEAWNDPEIFFPERFVGSSIDLRGHDFQLLPFGSGRRGCPGMQLGLTIVKHVIVQLVHCFDWELPGGMLLTELDMTEEFGLVTPRAKHLLAIPSYRLNI
ncbi:hypothetical protein KPL71_022208 [Citrus sinensis]|uniref:Uncharacterized protein n=2 Tax=Citrus sinensis TaxID=2711 RepID=A0ACB8JNI8_CITSI|nr:hypothetical protein KPL71_022208 [Citrus sinensis]